jgi:hypothetical protein
MGHGIPIAFAFWKPDIILLKYIDLANLPV